MGARAWPSGCLCPSPDCLGCGTRFAQTVLAPQTEFGTGAQPRPQAPGNGAMRWRGYNYGEAAKSQGTQSARNTLYSSGPLALRSETHTSSLPSGENMGKLLKWPSTVICSNPVPSSFTR